MVIIAFMCLHIRKRDKAPSKVEDTGGLEDSTTQTKKESETKFGDSVHETASVNNEHLKEAMSASSIPVPESD